MPITEIAQHRYGLEVFGHIPEDENTTKAPNPGCNVIEKE